MSGEASAPSSLWSAFEGSFGDDPGRLAVVDAVGEHSAGAVRERALSIAGGLAAQGVVPGSRVLVRGVSDVDSVAVALAAARLGATICPFNVQLGARELDGLVALVRPAVVVDAGLSTSPAGLAATEGELPPYPGRQETALIAFTGGTTGVPKAVVHDLEGIRYAVDHVARIGRIRRRESTLATLPIGSAPGFAFSVALSHLLGTTLVLQKFDAARQLDVARRYDCVWTMTIPTHIALMADAATAAGLERPLASMRALVVGGSPMTAERLGRWEAALGVPIVRMFGMSECLGHCSMRPEDPPERRLALDGHPFPGTDVEAFDADGQVLPRGVAGQAGVRGPSLFKGYLGQPELTASRTTADGFYLTGDQVVRGEDGLVRVTGRFSDTIIRGGTNIDPHEVAEFVMSMQTVTEAVVVGYPDERLGECLWLAVTVVPGAAPVGPEEVRAHLASYGVARFKHPDRVTTLPAIPRTEMAKVDRARLRVELEAAR